MTRGPRIEDLDPSTEPGSSAEPAPRADLRTVLVDVAARLFAQTSFEATSVAEICSVAGVTKGALYHYFDSKDDLLYEIYARMLRRQMADLESVADSEGPVLDRLRTIARDVVVTSVERLDDSRVFWRSLFNLPPEMQADFRAQRKKYHVRVRALIEAGQADGSIRSDLPSDLMIDFFYGAVHQLDSWYNQRGPLNGHQLGDYYAELFIRSVSP